jgi:hypothetical protein
MTLLIIASFTFALLLFLGLVFWADSWSEAVPTIDRNKGAAGVRRRLGDHGRKVR